MAAATSAIEYRDLAREIFTVLQAIDPLRLTAELRSAIKGQIDGLAARVRQAIEAAEGEVALLFEQVASVLEASPDEGGDWEAFRKRLHVAYDALVERLRREAVVLPTLRPTNYTRSLFHVGSAVGSALLVQHVLSPRGMVLVAGGFTLGGWGAEIARRHSPAVNRLMMFLFKGVSHEHERHQINSSTWYTTALLLISLSMSQMACTVALLVLGVGDPVAGLVGRRYGRVRLFNGKSLEGFVAFVASAALVSAVGLKIYYPALSASSVGVLSLSAAVAGALAELFLNQIDDNFSIPLAAGAGCSLAAVALSLP